MLGGNQALPQVRPLRGLRRLFLLHAFSFLWRKRVLCILENNQLRNTSAWKRQYVRVFPWVHAQPCLSLDGAPAEGTCAEERWAARGMEGTFIVRSCRWVAASCSFTRRAWQGGNITARRATACFAYSQGKQLKRDLVINVLCVL